MDQSFTWRNLRYLLKKGDGIKFGLGKTRAEIRDKLQAIAKQINSSDYTFARFKIQTRNSKNAFSVGSPTDEFAVRKLADNLRRSLKIRPVDRNAAVSEVLTLAREAVSATIIKIDIKSFFESIDRSVLLTNLASERSLSSHSVKLISQLLENTNGPKIGVPRGISVSALLSEYYIRTFEMKCRRFEGCYHFTRYVDDVVMFFHAPPPNPIELVQSLLPLGLSVNAEKTCIVKLDKLGAPMLGNGYQNRLSYLGYELMFDVAGALKVSISTKKINKIKTRIVYSLLDYAKSGDFGLLKMRLLVLTSNFSISSGPLQGELFTGIFYSHQFADPESCIEVLEGLDLFCRKAICARAGTLGKRLSGKLTNTQKVELCSVSFSAGYQRPIYRSFTPKQLAEVKEVWSHA